jgi:hypothetical protein
MEEPTNGYRPVHSSNELGCGLLMTVSLTYPDIVIFADAHKV